MFITCPGPWGGDQWEGVSARMLSHDILFFSAPSPMTFLIVGLCQEELRLVRTSPVL